MPPTHIPQLKGKWEALLTLAKDAGQVDMFVARETAVSAVTRPAARGQGAVLGQDRGDEGF